MQEEKPPSYDEVINEELPSYHSEVLVEENDPLNKEHYILVLFLVSLLGLTLWAGIVALLLVYSGAHTLGEKLSFIASVGIMFIWFSIYGILFYSIISWGTHTFVMFTFMSINLLFFVIGLLTLVISTLYFIYSRWSIHKRASQVVPNNIP